MFLAGPRDESITWKESFSLYLAALSQVEPQTKKQPMSFEERLQKSKKVYGKLSAAAKETKECVICVEPF